MPFCTRCGTSVATSAAYCRNCGAPQPRHTAEITNILSGISDRTAAMLCYIPVFGVIPAVVFLASQRFRQKPKLRFDAFQSLYLFVSWLIVSSAIPTLFFTGFPGGGIEHGLLELLKMALFVCWIVLLIKAAQQQQMRLPIIGDLAARSATEQV